ncbi:MAG TPA: DNA repair protein RecO [Flavobacterium sp.]|jgi:DNA repair protein RecO (recombination protein O)
MRVKTKAIVVSTLRYQEKSLIVKCFTEAAGLKSYFVHNAFSSSKSAKKMAYFQPLTILEIEAVHKNKDTLENFREVRLAVPYETISTDILKSTIAIFIAEMLHHSIREEEKNTDLYEYLETALVWLDHHQETANFHLILLLEITKFLGFYPDTDNISGSYFEMMEGVFTDLHAVSCLSSEETHLFKRLIGLKFSGSQKVFSAAERNILLKILLDYYSLHLEGFRRPKSLEVLKEVFA